MHALVTHSELDCVHGDVFTVVVGDEHGGYCDSQCHEDTICCLLHLAHPLHGPSIILDIVLTVREEAICIPSRLLRISCNIDVDLTT